jgi:hypothetical protein
MNQTDTSLIDTHGSFPSHKGIDNEGFSCSLPRLVIACKPIGVTFDTPYKCHVQSPTHRLIIDGHPNYSRDPRSVSVSDETDFDLN